MATNLELLEKVQSLVKKESLVEADAVLKENADFARKFPVIRKIVMNKKEVGFRESVAESAKEVQSGLQSVQQVLGKPGTDGSIMPASPSLGQLHEAVSSSKINHEQLRGFLERKILELGDIRPDLYPEKNTDHQEINIHDSMIDNSEILVQSIDKVKNYYVEVEKNGIPASELEAFSSFTSRLQQQMEDMKEVFHQQELIAQSASNFSRIQGVPEEINNIQSALQERDSIIGSHAMDIEKLKKRIGELGTSMGSGWKKLSEYEDVHMPKMKFDL